MNIPWEVRELGRCFWNPVAFDQRCTELSQASFALIRPIAVKLRQLQTKRNLSQYVDFVLERMLQTTGDEGRTLCAFYFAGPFDAFVRHTYPLSYHEHGPLIDFFAAALVCEHCSVSETIACHLCFLFDAFRAVAHTSFVLQFGKLVEMLCKFGPNERELLSDPVLWESLAVHVHIHASSHVAEVVCSAANAVAGNALFHALVNEKDDSLDVGALHDVFTPVVMAVARWVAAHPGTPAEATTSFLAGAMSISSLWRSLCATPLIALASQMWRWGSEERTCVEILQRSMSTELLLRLHRRDLLAPLVVHASTKREEEGEYATLVRVLQRLWPERVRAILNHPAPPPPAFEERSVHECPITLDRCIRPVVASDGRIYERDAILTHMASSSKSPLTGQPLRYALVDLYA